MEQILLCGVSALEYDIVCDASPAAEHAGRILSSWIEKITGGKMVGGKGVIDFHIEEDPRDEEGYSIVNVPGKLSIIGRGPRGVLYNSGQTVIGFICAVNCAINIGDVLDIHTGI